MTEKTVPATVEEHSRELTREEERYLSPPVDIFETKDGLTVVADLPGVPKENIEIRVDNGVLTIKGRTAHDTPGEAVYTEYQLLSFHRQFELSDQVDQEKISATMKQGVLYISLPKAEQPKPRQISVNVQ